MSDISDRVFIKNFSLLLGVLMALTFVLLILANMVGSLINKEETAELQDQAKALAERIKPPGQLKVAGSTGGQAMEGLVAAANAADSGKAAYDATCAVCHLAGIAGAPKLGDKAAWKDRIAQGKDTLYEHALKGFQGKVGFMPAKGGNTNLPDDDVKKAVDYMVNAAQ